MRNFASKQTAVSKQALPIYSICSLSDAPLSQPEFMADRFAHYLEAHRDLHFPHKHSFYHLVYFTEGSGKHSIDFVEFDVQPGQIYFMVPGQVHTWNFDSEPDGFIVNFSAQYISALVANPRYLEQFAFFSGIANEQVLNVPGSMQEKLVQTLEIIVEEGNATEFLSNDMARGALVQLFILVSRCMGNDNAKPKSANNAVLLRNFQKLIDQHYKEKKLTRDYAAMLYITPNHLNALSKDVTGRSAGELIRDRVLLEAKRLLVNAELSIAEIAAELEFVDNSYFSKFFKKYAGVTPDAFRKQINKK